MSDTNKNYGILAEYETVDEIISAAAKVRDAGLLQVGLLHTPMPVHGLDDAMGVKPTHLPLVHLVRGVSPAHRLVC